LSKQEVSWKNVNNHINELIDEIPAIIYKYIVKKANMKMKEIKSNPHIETDDMRIKVLNVIQLILVFEKYY
jgi:predicted DNA-binding transcriptional regulator